MPCNRELEVALASFADRASDVAAFAKNAGPQSLRIDYLQAGGQLAFYTPDFFVRTKAGHFLLIETKGREDRDVPRKAAAAVQWCESASTPASQWEYVYVTQGVFEGFRGDTIEMLASTCRPARQRLLEEKPDEAQISIFSVLSQAEEKVSDVTGFIDTASLSALPPRYRKAVEQAAMLFRFMEQKEGMNLGTAFNALLGSLDEACRGLLNRRLQMNVPAKMPDQRLYFEPDTIKVDRRLVPHYEKTALNLKKTLVFNNGISPLGLLRSCVDYALNDNTKLGGVFDALKEKFKVQGARDLLAQLTSVNEFRNTYVAHQEEELTNAALAKKELKAWIKTLKSLSEAP